MTRQLKHIVFDMDGTLIHTNHLYVEAIQKFVELMVEQGFKTEHVSALFRAAEKENQDSLGFAKSRFPASMRLAYEMLCQTYFTSADAKIRAKAGNIGNSVYRRKGTLDPNAVQVLEGLKEGPVQLHVLTMGDDEVQRKRLQDAGIYGYFNSVNVVKIKTKYIWQEMLNAPRMGGTVMDHIAVVGDSPSFDIVPAWECGVHAIHITAGPGLGNLETKQEFSAYGPRYIPVVSLLDSLPPLAQLEPRYNKMLYANHFGD